MKKQLLLVLCAAAAALLAGCPTAANPEAGVRTLTFHVPARLFGNPTDPDPGKQGPGIDAVTVTADLSGGTAAAVTGSFAAASFGTGSYASFTITVDGKLTGIRVVGSAASVEVVSASVSDFSEAEMARYGGYSIFANVLHFKLDWYGGDSTTGMLRILPCPRASAKVRVDSGAQSGVYDLAIDTDHFAVLTTLQVAVQPEAAEDNADESLLFTVYYAVSENDPSVECNPANFAVGTYLEYPWTAQWTYGEVTGTKGKTIGETTYVMTKLAGDPRPVGNADDYGRRSALINLSGSGAEAGQFLLYCVLLTRGGLSVPSDVGCVEIR